MGVLKRKWLIFPHGSLVCTDLTSWDMETERWKESWRCKSYPLTILPSPRYRVLHLPSQTNHAFQDIWRQLANYWRALAPERQLGQPGSNSASMEQNMFIIRLKICSGYSRPGLCRVSWWHWDVGQGPGLWQARSGWHDDWPLEMTQVRWHMTDDTMSPQQPLSPFVSYSPSLWGWRLSPWPFVWLLGWGLCLVLG